MTISFTVPGIPIAQPRQRHRVAFINGKPIAANYLPKSDPVNAWKASVQLAARQAYNGPPLDEPLILTAILVFPRPKSKIWKTRPMPREPKTSKPDGDNVLKSLKDALSKLTYRDDAIIFDERCIRFVAAGNEQPHSEIVIKTLDVKNAVHSEIVLPLPHLYDVA